MADKENVELVGQSVDQKPEATNVPLQESQPPADQPAPPSAPPDGGQLAWLQVLGVFFCWFNSWSVQVSHASSTYTHDNRGLTNAFGVFQTYYQDDLLRNKTPSQISWVGSLQSFLLIAVGVLSGPAYDAGYFTALLWSGSFLVVFGYFMTSLCKEYWQVMLAQGLVIGVGTGCLFVPAVSILPQYFVKRRALANGIAAAGSSFGSSSIFCQASDRP